MDLFFLTITWLGSLYVLAPLSLVLAAKLFSSQRYTDLLLLLGGLAGISFIVHGLKLLVARPRPPVEGLLVAMPSDFSFPSAHTAQVTAFLFACALIFAKELPPREALLLWSGLGMIALLVGVSRIYLKVHYISDVVVGLVLGALWIFFLQWLLNAYGDRGMV
ncbi:phosphatase PAP2 family protein [Desulfopila aestuarii]|uniref:Undecaprenyl-diphosphatase n=1 Tax=Desulfopila aestuarii DSM 18488 TaxID=1121416 RepID=A0A1M7Y563_9BACT|nr:phosphatase PAP2 family protein [Desulfopila aestuarii]SHO47582.1 undecaprenyl-diphosphatase [Desulfopila aestuarii DSM 18488]